MMLYSDTDHRKAEKERNHWCPDHSTENTNSMFNKVTRKFINSAIYVEKPLSATISTESFGQKCSNEELWEPKTKRCTCSVEPRTCPCHCDSSTVNLELKENEKKAVSSTAVVSKVSLQKNRGSASFGNLISDSASEQKMKKWMAKKEEEKKKKQVQSKIIQEARIKEKEMLLEQERRNFQTWLMNKKKIENQAKKKRDKELEERQLKELEKEKRQLQNQLNFQLWLKKKEEALIEKKIQKQIELINALERKEQQMKENERAFNDWLKNSKTRQRPPPLNRGLESLCSSTSVTYVNPNPWKPNQSVL